MKISPIILNNYSASNSKQCKNLKQGSDLQNNPSFCGKNFFNKENLETVLAILPGLIFVGLLCYGNSQETQREETKNRQEMCRISKDPSLLGMTAEEAKKMSEFYCTPPPKTENDLTKFVEAIVTEAKKIAGKAGKK